MYLSICKIIFLNQGANYKGVTLKHKTTILVELLRYDDSTDDKVFEELLELQQYIALRTAKNKDLEYYIVSYSKRKGKDKGVVIVIRGMPEIAYRESELLVDYIKGRFTTITCNRLNNRGKTIKLELPVSQNFF